MNKPILFYTPSCPYCIKVLDFINNNEDKIQIRFANMEQERNRELLETLTSSKRRPVLYYEDHQGKDILLYESDKIIEKLSNMYCGGNSYEGNDDDYVYKRMRYD